MRAMNTQFIMFGGEQTLACFTTFYMYINFNLNFEQIIISACTLIWNSFIVLFGKRWGRPFEWASSMVWWVGLEVGSFKWNGLLKREQTGRWRHRLLWRPGTSIIFRGFMNSRNYHSYLCAGNFNSSNNQSSRISLTNLINYKTL